VCVTAVALQTLLNDKYKLESLQGDGSRTRQETLKMPAEKLGPVIVVSLSINLCIKLVLTEFIEVCPTSKFCWQSNRIYQHCTSTLQLNEML